VDYSQLVIVFTSILYEALPFIVLGVILAGLFEEFVPQQWLIKVIPRRKRYVVIAIAMGGFLGMIFPMCECGIIPIMRRLLRKGIPLSVCTCYVLAGPVVNLVVITATMYAFSGQTIPLGKDLEIPQSVAFATLRCGLVYLIAVTTSIVVEIMWRKHGTALLQPSIVRGSKYLSDEEEEEAKKHTWFESLNHVSETAMHDFIDIMAFLVIGAAIASFGRLIIPELHIDTLIGDNPVIAIAVMMALAICFCICSEADAFVAANFQPVNFWPLSSKLAFLVLGPMLDFKLIMMYTSVFRYRLIVTIIVCLVVQTFACSVVVHYLSEAWLQQYR
jgi:uncharacterized membrane protein YraQ (UPF0718 family)